jgi:hypothetical protein
VSSAEEPATEPLEFDVTLTGDETRDLHARSHELLAFIAWVPLVAWTISAILWWVGAHRAAGAFGLIGAIWGVTAVRQVASVYRHVRRRAQRRAPGVPYRSADARQVTVHYRVDEAGVSVRGGAFDGDYAWDRVREVDLASDPMAFHTIGSQVTVLHFVPRRVFDATMSARFDALVARARAADPAARTRPTPRSALRWVVAVLGILAVADIVATGVRHSSRPPSSSSSSSWPSSPSSH